MASLALASIQRQGYVGHSILLSNGAGDYFGLRGLSVDVVHAETEQLPPPALGIAAKEYKFRLAEYLDLTGIDEVIYLDCDCLVIGDLTRLTRSDTDLTCAVESWGRISNAPFNAHLTDEEMAALTHPPINSGLFRAKADNFVELMRRWQEIYESPRLRASGFIDQPSWVRLALDLGERADFWPAGGLVRYPLAENLDELAIDEAVVLHYCGGSAEARLRGMEADFARLFVSYGGKETPVPAEVSTAG